MQGGFAWVLLWPEDGVLRKEEVRQLLDGSLYQHKVLCPHIGGRTNQRPNYTEKQLIETKTASKS